jgi:hypothetical protein
VVYVDSRGGAACMRDGSCCQSRWCVQPTSARKNTDETWYLVAACKQDEELMRERRRGQVRARHTERGCGP